MNVLRTLAFRFALAVPRPKCEPYIYRLDTLKELDAAAMTATTALCELADAARYADEVHDHPSVAIRIKAVHGMERQLEALDDARRQLAQLVKQGRIELGR